MLLRGASGHKEKERTYVKMPLARSDVLQTHSVNRRYGNHIADAAFIDPPQEFLPVRKVVVLLHGYNTHGESWSPVFVSRLLRSHCRVVIPTYNHTFESIVGAAGDVIDMSCDAVSNLLGPSVVKYVVVGHSMGGMIAQEVAYELESGQRCLPQQRARLCGVVLCATSVPARMWSGSRRSRTQALQQFQTGYSERQQALLQLVEPAVTSIAHNVVRSAGADPGGVGVDDEVRRTITQFLQSVHAVIATGKMLACMHAKHGQQHPFAHWLMSTPSAQSRSLLSECERTVPRTFDELLERTRVERQHAGAPLRSTAVGVHERVRNVAQLSAVLGWLNGTACNHVVAQALTSPSGVLARTRPMYLLVFGGRDTLFPPHHMKHVADSIGEGASVTCVMCPRASHNMTKVFDDDRVGVQNILHRSDVTLAQHCCEGLCQLHDAAHVLPGMKIIISFVERL